MSEEIEASVLPSLEEDREQIQKVIREISNCKTRIEGENEYIKDALSDLSKQFKIPKASLVKLANIYHKRNSAEERAKSEEVFNMYDVIFKTS
jgi:hypothetical protein